LNVTKEWKAIIYFRPGLTRLEMESRKLNVTIIIYLFLFLIIKYSKKDGIIIKIAYRRTIDLVNKTVEYLSLDHYQHLTILKNSA
jgi:hypothetical protein